FVPLAGGGAGRRLRSARGIAARACARRLGDPRPLAAREARGTRSCRRDRRRRRGDPHHTGTRARRPRSRPGPRTPPPAAGRRRRGDSWARRDRGRGRTAHSPHHRPRARPAACRRKGCGRAGGRHKARRPLPHLLPAGVRRLRGRNSPRRAGRPRVKDLFRVRRMWRPRGELKPRYDVVIVGGGAHGLATAYYLARTRGMRNVAVLGQRYIGSGAAGRHTTIIRSNSRTPEGAAFYKKSVELYEGLGRELDFNLLFSQQGHLTLAHSERAMVTMTER